MAHVKASCLSLYASRPLFSSRRLQFVNQANPPFFPSSRCKVGKASGLEKHRGTAWCPKSSKKISTFPNETGAARATPGSSAPRYSWHQEGNRTESGPGAEQHRSTSRPGRKAAALPEQRGSEVYDTDPVPTADVECSDSCTAGC